MCIRDSHNRKIDTKPLSAKPFNWDIGDHRRRGCCRRGVGGGGVGRVRVEHMLKKVLDDLIPFVKVGLDLSNGSDVRVECFENLFLLLKL
jgi:hypothetical protein